MSYSVGEVSRLAKVSIRTLHHYDAIGLLAPTGRSDAGYRLYHDADVARLAQVLFYRELGFSLQDISVILDDPSTDVAVHLRRQKELLREHMERIEAKAAAITRALEAIAMNEPLSAQQAREIFGWWPSEDLAERQRTRTGRPEGWDPLAGKTGAELEAIEAHRADFASRLLGAFESGEGPESPQAMELAEEHFQDLRSVFECTYEIQAAICDGYVNESETFLFAVRPTEDRPGLAAFLRDAAQANAMRAGGHE